MRHMTRLMQRIAELQSTTKLNQVQSTSGQASTNHLTNHELLLKNRGDRRRICVFGHPIALPRAQLEPK